MGDIWSSLTSSNTFTGPRGPILNLLNDDEQENLNKLFADYRTLLMSTSFQIGDMICIIEGYESLTFDRDRLSELQRPDGPIDVDRLSQLYDKAKELQPKIRGLVNMVEQRKRQESIDEAVSHLNEMYNVLVSLCQQLTAHKGNADAMNRVLRYGNPRDGVYCHIDKNLLSKLKDTEQYIEACEEKAKPFLD